jgi:hypothetical protein
MTMRGFIKPCSNERLAARPSRAQRRRKYVFDTLQCNATQHRCMFGAAALDPDANLPARQSTAPKASAVAYFLCVGQPQGGRGVFRSSSNVSEVVTPPSGKRRVEHQQATLPLSAASHVTQVVSAAPKSGSASQTVALSDRPASKLPKTPARRQRQRKEGRAKSRRSEKARQRDDDDDDDDDDENDDESDQQVSVHSRSWNAPQSIGRCMSAPAQCSIKHSSIATPCSALTQLANPLFTVLSSPLAITKSASAGSVLESNYRTTSSARGDDEIHSVLSQLGSAVQQRLDSNNSRILQALDEIGAATKRELQLVESNSKEM